MEKGTGIPKRRFRIFQVSGGSWRLAMIGDVGLALLSVPKLM
jgi:hypothetical protein